MDHDLSAWLSKLGHPFSFSELPVEALAEEMSLSRSDTVSPFLLLMLSALCLCLGDYSESDLSICTESLSYTVYEL